MSNNTEEKSPVFEGSFIKVLLAIIHKDITMPASREQIEELYTRIPDTKDPETLITYVAFGGKSASLKQLMQLETLIKLSLVVQVLIKEEVSEIGLMPLMHTPVYLCLMH